MRTSDQTSTFKVYKSHANNTYKNIEKDKIESAFVEFVKEKGEIGNDRYFNVKYKTVNGTDIFEFTRASTQPSPPLQSTQPSLGSSPTTLHWNQICRLVAGPLLPHWLGTLQ